MPRKFPHITPAELEIMKVLWRLGSGTVQQTLDALAAGSGQTPAYTTVMTMMKNLAEKKALKVERTRQPFVYTPAVGKEKVQRQRLSQLLKTVFDGNVEDLILHLAEETDLSAEDLHRIEEKIKACEEEEAEGSSEPDDKET